jgi:hypothetical protein
LGFPPFTTAVLESSILVLVGLKRRENREKERREREIGLGFSFWRGWDVY